MEPNLRQLAAIALDTAKAGRARYADVRFTTTRERTFISTGQPIDREQRTVGVRARVQPIVANRQAWGFAAGTEWTSAWLERLGRVAPGQAYGNLMGFNISYAAKIQWNEYPVIATGHWETPNAHNPFLVPLEEPLEALRDLEDQAKQLKGNVQLAMTFVRQERVFASTDGAFATQTVYTAFADIPATPSYIVLKPQGASSCIGMTTGYQVPSIAPRGGGYEQFDVSQWRAQLPEWIDHMHAIERATPLPNPGRYEVVFDAAAMAAIISSTFAPATEMDRIYERYRYSDEWSKQTISIEKLLPRLGTSVASAAVTITANRSMPGGAATVHWDDEGIAPHDFTLVKDGVLMDYATNREYASLLTPWYQAHGQTAHFNGCTGASNALTTPVVQSPNLVLQPDMNDTSFADLVSGIAEGMAILGGHVQSDVQQSSCLGTGGVVYAIKHGKLAGVLTGAIYLFQTDELWKNIVALGGAQTAATRGFTSVKGDPVQRLPYSVHAVAARVKNVRVLDTRARAG
jgi:TldD protein